MLQRKKTQIPAVSASFRQAISFTQAGGKEMRFATLTTMAITIAASAPVRALADPIVTVYVA